MSEKLEKLAEAQAAVRGAEDILAAVSRLTHETTFGQVRTMRAARRLPEPQSQATPLSTIERNVLLAALRGYEETALAQVHAAEANVEGMLK